MARIFLCQLDELNDPGSRGFDEEVIGEGFFVVRRGEHVFAYRNSCPHTRAPLEWLPDQFLDFHGEYIECSLHGALFSLHEGRCLRGPCVGDSLQSLPVSVDDGAVYLLR